nr:ribonuclease H-like domain-containing protein [Tanacetum cinerariifolium]
MGKKGYVLGDVWEKCEQYHGGTPYAWHDEGHEEEKLSKLGLRKRICTAYSKHRNLQSKSTSSTNKADNIAYGVSIAHTQGNTVNSTSVDNLSDAMICAFLVSQPNSSQLAKENLEQIDPDDLEEMDLQWEMAMLTIRARRFIKRTGKNLDKNGQKIGFDRSKVDCFNYHKMDTLQENVELQRIKKTEAESMCYQAEEVHLKNFALMALTSSGSSFSSDSENLEKALKERDEIKLTSKKYQNSTKSLNTWLEIQENVKSRSDKGYLAVPLPYTRNYIPPKPDLMFIDEQVKSESVDVVSTISSSVVKNVESKVKSVDVKNKGQPIAEGVQGNKVIDSGCSKHMIGNKCYLTDYEDYDGGFVSFGDGKGRISRKGIKREFSVARTPQQNGVAERQNRTLIKAARTKLVDSKLLTTFWAEAVNTTCYVPNNALVIKPHNKTPYELIHGRPLLIDFMKPFGCPVSIINTKDYLGKFDEKFNTPKFTTTQRNTTWGATS